MRVAIFTDNDFEKVNGVTTTLRAVLEHAPDELDLRIYTCDSIGIECNDYLSLPSFGVGIPFYRAMTMYYPPFRQFLRHAMADGIDVVHLTTPGPVGLAALWVAAHLELPLIGSFHTDLTEYTRVLSGSEWLARLMQTYLRWSYDQCGRVFAPSESTRTLLIQAKLDASKIEIWRRGVSTTAFNPAKRSLALRDHWQLSEDRPAIAYVGRLSREKDLDLLAPISRHLDASGLAHRVVVVGDGPVRDELQEALPEAIFTGMLTPDDVAAVMASCDLFVFPSRTDTAGNVVLEAQASGLPVLVSDLGGPQENICPSRSGFVCATPEDFARRAADLLRNPDLRWRFHVAARSYARSRQWETALEPLYRAYLAPAPAEATHPLAAEPATAL
jgi:glycosyltransferase involved in cell wall biosynthesis